jgi:hypothetical protein
LKHENTHLLTPTALPPWCLHSKREDSWDRPTLGTEWGKLCWNSFSETKKHSSSQI